VFASAFGGLYRFGPCSGGISGGGEGLKDCDDSDISKAPEPDVITPEVGEPCKSRGALHSPAESSSLMEITIVLVGHRLRRWVER
jgi:hypothetical protein